METEALVIRRRLMATLVGAALAVAAGPALAGEADRRDASATLHVEGMTCPSCKVAVQVALAKLPGVRDVTVEVAEKRAAVEFDPAKVTPAEMVDAVNRLGYRASVAGPAR